MRPPLPPTWREYLQQTNTRIRRRLGLPYDWMEEGL